MSLACMEIIYEHLGMTVDRQELQAYFGTNWTVEQIVRFLTSYNYVVVPGPPVDGDIIFQGQHPGVVKGKLVENYHRDRRCFWPLRRLNPDLVLRKT
jgi:hypothetical protein